MTSRIIYIALLLTLWGCSTSHQTRTYEIPRGSLILTDDLAVIQQACKGAVALGTIIGCYTPVTQTIYCSVNDLATCGHELLHHVGLRHENFEHDPANPTRAEARSIEPELGGNMIGTNIRIE